MGERGGLRVSARAKADIERQLQEVLAAKAALDEKRQQLEGILSKYEEMVSKYAGAMSGPAPFGPRPGTRPEHVPL